MTTLKGTTLNKQYFLRELVGSGGMADVYLAWDTLRSAKMAVKVLRRDLSQNPGVIKTFEKEAKYLQDLTHPFIVRFYELGSELGITYIVMAWVDGIDLKKRIESLNRPLSLGEVIPVLQPICSALNFAHQKNRFHCDIKPSNVLLHENGKDALSSQTLAWHTPPGNRRAAAHCPTWHLNNFHKVLSAPKRIFTRLALQSFKC